MKDKELLRLQTECKEDNKLHRFDISYYIFQSEGQYIAYCPSLDLTTTGEDFNDAVFQFHECFQLYVETCLEMGTLLEDLKNHGWKLKRLCQNRRALFLEP